MICACDCMNECIIRIPIPLLFVSICACDCMNGCIIRIPIPLLFV